MNTLFILNNSEKFKNKKFLCIQPVLDLALKGTKAELQKKEAEIPYWGLINLDGETIENLTGFELWKEIVLPMDFKQAINSNELVRSEFWKNDFYRMGPEILNTLIKCESFSNVLNMINGKWYPKGVEEIA